MLRSHVSLPAPRSSSPFLCALRFAWTFPTNALAHLACRFLVSGKSPERVGGRAAAGWIYPLRRGIGLDWVRAVTLGHVILYQAGLFEGTKGRAILAHELAHTRQHDLLGPLYLPVHLAAQAASALISLFTGRPVHSRVHDHNPLEQTFICIAAAAPDDWPAQVVKAGVDPKALLGEFGCG